MQATSKLIKVLTPPMNGKLKEMFFSFKALILLLLLIGPSFVEIKEVSPVLVGNEGIIRPYFFHLIAFIMITFLLIVRRKGISCGGSFVGYCFYSILLSNFYSLIYIL